MSNIYSTNYNFYDSNVRFVFNNSGCKNTSTIKYDYTKPNSDKYNRRKGDIGKITKDFQRGINNYTRNLVDSIFSNMQGDSEDDMDY